MTDKDKDRKIEREVNREICCTAAITVVGFCAALVLMALTIKAVEWIARI